MATTVKKIYNQSGLYSLKLPGVIGNNIAIQLEVHGAGGGGTSAQGTLSGNSGGPGAYVAGMYNVPGGTNLEIAVGDGGKIGGPNGAEDNAGKITGWEFFTGWGGSGGNGGEGVQGGGGGAMSSVLMWYSGSYYASLQGSWPRNTENSPSQNQMTVLAWAGGGGGGAGPLNNNRNKGTDGQGGWSINVIHGRSYYYSGNYIGGQMVDEPGYGKLLNGNEYGGGGSGGFADTSPYALYSPYYKIFYNYYTGPGTGGYYYYSGKSAQGGSGGASGTNAWQLSSVDWYETPTGEKSGAPIYNWAIGGVAMYASNTQASYLYGKKYQQSFSRYGFGGFEASDGGNGRVVVNYIQLDNQPNELGSFISEFDAEIDTYYTTRDPAATILGLGTGIGIPARIISPTDDPIIIINGNPINLQPGQFVTVYNGTTIKLRVKSAPTFNTVNEYFLRVGVDGAEVESRYVIGTKAPVPPIANTFVIPPVNDAYPNALVTSDKVTITGNYESAPIVVTATDSVGSPVPVQLFIDDTSRDPADKLVILNGSTLQLKVNASSSPNGVITVRVTIGDGSPVDWLVTTIGILDTGPDFYNFENNDDAVGGTEVLSNIVLITGINYNAVVTASNSDNIPVYASVNGSTEWIDITTGVVEVINNSTLQLKLTAPNIPNKTVTTEVVVGTNQYGSLSDIWRVRTNVIGDTFPDQFTFADRLNQKATTLVYSNSITVKGTTSPAPLAISIPSDFVGSQAAFSINSGNDWWNLTPGSGHPASPAPQFISPNGTLILRLRTGPYGANSSIINVDIGGRTDEWSVTPLSESPVTEQASTWYSSISSKFDGYTIGTVISVFRDSTGSFGILDGSPESRYPGFIECDGRELSATEYPDLFDTIGNIYGGNATKSAESPYEYSGVFRIPDYRNRKLYGTGRVDGNAGSSPAVPTFIGPDGEGTGSSTTVGSQGGYWYVDKIDPKGPFPREQLYEDEISGEFFGLGTMKTSGYENVTAQVLFNINGNCTATIGPLREVVVKTPTHSHELVSSQVLDTQNGLIGWGTPALLPTGRINGNNNFTGVYPGAPNAPVQRGGGDWEGEVTYSNYWASAVKDNAILDNTGGGIRLGAIDVGQNSSANVVAYNPGGTLTHTHYIGNTPYAGNTFSYGNVNGSGTMYGGSGQNTVDVSFSSAQLSLLSEVGTFTLSTRKAILPTVKFRPNVTIPLISKYYRAKYIIKAF